MVSDPGMIRKPDDLEIHVAEDERYIRISAMIPWVAEEQIRIDMEHASMMIGFPGEEEMVRKVVSIPGGSRMIRKTFSRGILEITLERPPSRPGNPGA